MELRSTEQPVTKVGLVLAGGMSRRMGQDKALMMFRGERLVDRIIGKLESQVDVLILNRPQRLDGIPSTVLQVSDKIDGFQGPLAGVHAALSSLAESNLDSYQLFTAPVDCPFIPMDLVERLNACPAPVAFAASDGQRHPVCARWPAAALPIIEQALKNGRRRIDRVAEDLGFQEVDWPLQTLENLTTVDPFINVNTIDEFNMIAMNNQ